MKTPNLLTASLDDMVFEGRNKAYGAYVLRRIYTRHLTAAALIAVALFLILVSIPLAVQHMWPAPVAATALPTLPPPMIYIVDPTLPSKPVVPSPVSRPVVVTPRTAATPTRVIADDRVKSVTQIPDNQLVDQQASSQDGPTGTVTAPGTATGAAGKDSGAAVAPAPAKPFVYAEVMPEFAGGPEALRNYMQRNLKYPRAALANGASGRVFVSFTVQADGSISDVEVLKGLGYGTEEEAARVVRNMPPWTPGRQNSMAVAVRYTLPITFHYE